MTPFRIIPAGFVLGALLVAAAHVSAGDALHDLDGLLAPVIARARIPGAVAVVLRGDQIIAQGAAGVRKRGGVERITLHDAFELASCTKAMTATLTAVLVEEGRLTWDTTLGEMFADADQTVHTAWQKVTVRQTLAHRGGLKDRPLQFLWSARSRHGDATAQRRRYVRKVLSRAPADAPGSRFRYGGTSYVVVAAALEELTGQSYDALLRDRLFAPTGITTGGLGPPGTPGLVDQPWGHGRLRLFGVLPAYGLGYKSFDPGSANADFPRAGAPAGMVHMSVIDWSKFVALHLRGDPANPHRRTALLEPATFASLHRADVGAGYSGGWFIASRPWAHGGRAGDGGRVLFHAGDNGRWTCVAWVAPEIDFAILIACNRGGMHRPIDEIAGALVGRFARPAPATDNVMIGGS